MVNLHYLAVFFKEKGEEMKERLTGIGTTNPESYLNFLPDDLRGTDVFIGENDIDQFPRSCRHLWRSFMKDLQAAVNVILINEDNVTADPLLGRSISTSSASSKGNTTIPSLSIASPKANSSMLSKRSTTSSKNTSSMETSIVNNKSVDSSGTFFDWTKFADLESQKGDEADFTPLYANIL